MKPIFLGANVASEAEHAHTQLQWLIAWFMFTLGWIHDPAICVSFKISFEARNFALALNQHLLSVVSEAHANVSLELYPPSWIKFGCSV